MKDKIKKILIFIGFVVVVISAITGAINKRIDIATYLPAVFVICFIFASNKTLNNFGYAISAVNIGIGLTQFYYLEDMMLFVGLLIMGLASIIYFIEIVLAFFGYVSNNVKGSKCADAKASGFAEIEKYAQMVKDGILNENEYTELKSKILEVDTKKSSTIEDLKKWKKLLDNKLLTEEEFSSIKAKILG